MSEATETVDAIRAERDQLRAQVRAVLDLCDEAERGSLTWPQAPAWVAQVRGAVARGGAR